MRSVFENVESVREAVSKAVTYKQVFDELNVSSAPGNYERLRKYAVINNIDLSHFTGYVTTDKWEEAHLRNVVQESQCYVDVLRKLGLRTEGSNNQTLKKYLLKYGIDTGHFVGTTLRKTNGGPKKRTIAEMFCLSSTVERSVIKRHILQNGLIPYVCSECPNTGMWNSKPLTLQLEHKNGISNDHRLENLEFLCPNCHSQTATYAGRNVK